METTPRSKASAKIFLVKVFLNVTKVSLSKQFNHKGVKITSTASFVHDIVGIPLSH